MPTKTKTRARKSPKKPADSRRCAEATGYDGWHRLAENRPKTMQWIVLIYAPKGRLSTEERCPYIQERIFRFERHKYFDVFRTRSGVDFILSPDHERDALWCALPSQPPHVEAWGPDEAWSQNK